MNQQRHPADRDPRALSISDLDYPLPDHRIARYPLVQRDAAKLLVYRHGRIRDHRFTELPEELPSNALLVLNDTRVIHARLHFKRHTGARMECMLLGPEEGRPIEQALSDEGRTRWWCVLGGAKRWKGEELVAEAAGSQLYMERIDRLDGEQLIEFRWEGDAPFSGMLDLFGQVPLPPYLRREAEEADDRQYNTVFAERPGSVAAPTASLHFTPDLLERIVRHGVDLARVTLHVGAGTFMPVKSDTMAGHDMHSEHLLVPRQAVVRLIQQIGAGPVLPVGTTAMRTIESLYWFGAYLAEGGMAEQMTVGQWQPYGDQRDTPVGEALEAVLAWLDRKGLETLRGQTKLLIAPGYRYRLCDGLITNFHQPHSTLLLLVAALVGPAWRQVYEHALQSDYRFLSFGDGSLLWREGA